jgi:hypothetical protein
LSEYNNRLKVKEPSCGMRLGCDNVERYTKILKWLYIYNGQWAESGFDLTMEARCGDEGEMGPGEKIERMKKEGARREGRREKSAVQQRPPTVPRRRNANT